jgi:hypothetical protein
MVADAAQLIVSGAIFFWVLSIAMLIVVGELND